MDLNSFPAKNSTDPPIYLQEEACFLFDVNFNSTQYLYVTHILTTLSLTAITGNAVVIFKFFNFSFETMRIFLLRAETKTKYEHKQNYKLAAISSIDTD